MERVLQSSKDLLDYYVTYQHGVPSAVRDEPESLTLSTAQSQTIP